MEKFFDKVNHCRLMATLAKRIEDKSLLKLIRNYLKSGIIINGIVTASEEGTPQDSPFSPLLSNILLDELDEELEERVHKYVRYANDCNIYVKTIQKLSDGLIFVREGGHLVTSVIVGR
ncbi:retron-type reverse transcriptase [Sporosarcina psychrophila]|uniref:Retron-type reverse transcriptase n=1 Tax=Sporosarcina psychrophila TaxID=1476 RepID=A0ABV2KAG5_SPOPS